MRLVQVALRAHDLERATSFYGNLIGAQPRAVFDSPGLVFFEIGGIRLLLEKGAPPSLVYLEVADLQRTVDGLREQGVRIVAEPHLIFVHEDDRLGPAGSEEWMAFIMDSEDNTVGLVSRVRTSGD